MGKNIKTLNVKKVFKQNKKKTKNKKRKNIWSVQTVFEQYYFVLNDQDMVILKIFDF